MINEIQAQTGLTSFIIATRTSTGLIKLKYVGKKPSMTDYERKRRLEVIKNAFDMFNQTIAPISINYDVSRCAGIARIAREAS